MPAVLVAALTARGMERVCVRLPDTPVIVTVVAPVTATAPEAITSVLVLVVELPGLNSATVPFGRPDTESVTLPVNLSAGSIVMVLAAAPCSLTYNLAGVAISEKLCARAEVAEERSVKAHAAHNGSAVVENRLVAILTRNYTPVRDLRALASWCLTGFGDFRLKQTAP